MSTRTDLAAYLQAHLPTTWTFYDRALDPTISRTTVMTYIETLEPDPGPERVKVTCQVLVLTPKQTGGEADLEAALDQVLAVIDTHNTATWMKAQASVYADTYPCYRVDVAWYETKE
ncbi:hypothetical protein [Cellulomonas sp. SG140]|uniref:hypothetical protein n=1 Tax=Cellulomonas sp. SG140 TaxID=2976536 RepID=UPI0021E949D9|nr:hypothetical protein [Cellulomonas sp. SG140]